MQLQYSYETPALLASSEQLICNTVAIIHIIGCGYFMYSCQDDIESRYMQAELFYSQ